MFLYDANKGFAINADHVVSIMIGREKDAIVFCESSGMLRKSATFETETDTKVALKMLIDRMNTSGKNVVIVPTREDVRTRIMGTKEHHHHAIGKKMKGHGGS